MPNAKGAIFRYYPLFLDPPPCMKKDTLSRTFALAGIIFVRVLLLALIIIYAWMGDDAFITLRTVDNFVSGDGLTWNPGERVQAYTHPLWMFVLSAFYFFTREPFYTTLVVSILISGAAVLLFERFFCRRGAEALPLLLAFAMSRAFIDYATSGLENPLTYLILVLFYARVIHEGSLLELAFLAALGMLNRMDTALLFAPALVWRSFVGFRTQGKSFLREFLQAVFIGGSPFLVWELFSLLYYGSFVPNTALAKLNHGIPRLQIWKQGVLYLFNSLSSDPVTLVFILSSLAVPWIKRDAKHTVIGVGLALYLLYIVNIGGDFMSGRFLAAPFIPALVLYSRLPIESWRAAATLAVLTLVVGFIGSVPTLLFNSKRNLERSKIDRWGIADERRYYAHSSSLFTLGREVDGPTHPWRSKGEFLDNEMGPDDIRPVHRAGNIGYRGFYAAKDITIVDAYALADPLLARLPARRDLKWRIGHFSRAMPSGYIASLRTGSDKFQDEDLGQYWQKIDLITRGSLFSRERLAAIWQLNTGALDHLIDWERYRYGGAPRFDFSELQGEPSPLEETKQDTPSKAKRTKKQPKKPTKTHKFTDIGLLIDFSEPSYALQLDLRVSDHGVYELHFRLHGQIIATVETKKIVPQHERLETITIQVPENAIASGYDEIRLIPLQGERPFFLEYLRFTPEGEL